MELSASKQEAVGKREPVWPATVAILIVAMLALATPNRYTLGPRWFALGSAGILIGLLALSALGDWLKLSRPFQRFVILATACIVALFNVLSLSKLIYLLVAHSKSIDGSRLLSSSVMVWISNVIAFAMIYWLIDGRGPDARRRSYTRTDFQFPQPASPDAADAAWRPNFMDYIYLSFSTATAFSTTDTMPLTTRVRMLMMIESIVSLLTIAIAAARAINVL